MSMNWCDRSKMFSESQPSFQNVHMPHASVSCSSNPSSLALHSLSPPPSPSPSSSMSMDISMLSPSVASDPSLSNIDHITSLERVLCSDFTCCNVRLPDLHALIEHSEENHIPILSENGRPVFFVNVLRRMAQCTPPPSLTASPASSRSSSVLSSPTSTMSPLSPVSSDSFPSTPGSDAIFDKAARKPSSLPPLCSNVYTPFTPLHSENPACPTDEFAHLTFSPDYAVDYPHDCFDSPFSSPSPIDYYSTEVMPSDVVFDGLTSPTTSQHPSAEKSEHLLPAITITTKKSAGALKIKKKVSIRRAESLSLSDSPGGKSSSSLSSKGGITKARQTTASGGRKREKAFRCPTVGCTKSYLNPNGLKYHLEKGTCKIEDIPMEDVSDDNTSSINQESTSNSNQNVDTSSALTSSAVTQQNHLPQPTANPHSYSQSCHDAPNCNAAYGGYSRVDKIPYHAYAQDQAVGPRAPTAVPANEREWRLSPQKSTGVLTGVIVDRCRGSADPASVLSGMTVPESMSC